MEQIEDAHSRKKDARTEIESLEADKDFAKYQLSLEENWKEFKHLFDVDDCADEFGKGKPPVDYKDEDTRDFIARISERVKSIRAHVVHIEKDLQDLRSMYE
jgi:hypothetical protein